jgi:hypothetical protein
MGQAFSPPVVTSEQIIATSVLPQISSMPTSGPAIVKAMAVGTMLEARRCITTRRCAADLKVGAGTLGMRSAWRKAVKGGWW